MSDLYSRIVQIWASPDREMAMHRLVEKFAAEGFGRKEIEEALVKQLLEIRKAGADEQSEDIIADVGSRIAGWCNKDSRIKTIDEAI